VFKWILYKVRAGKHLPAVYNQSGLK